MSEDDKTINFDDEGEGVTVEFSGEEDEEAIITPNTPDEEDEDAAKLKEQDLAPPKKADKKDSHADELGEYSAKVQKRINDLTAKRRTAEAEGTEAVRVSKVLQEENQKLKGQLQNLDTGYLSEYDSRLTSEDEAATKALKAAMEAEDPEAQIAAQKILTRVAVERDKHTAAKTRSATAVARREEEEKVAKEAPAAPTAPKPDPRAAAWAKERDWFGEHKGMTFTALSISQELIETEGVDPTSDEYYTKLDERMVEQFPAQLGKKPAPPKKKTIVAPAGDSASKKLPGRKRSVRLTASQVAIANRLNVPLDEYAKYVKEE